MEGSVLSRLFTYAFSIYLLVSAVALKRWYDLAQERKLRKLVAWSVTGDYCPVLGNYSYSRELWYKVANAQANLNIPKEYCINETEKVFCLQILSEYQIELARKYFLGNLCLIKSKYAVYGDEYFMMKLHDFLSSHSDDYKFLGYEMHNPCTPYSSFEIAYHKLFYITYMYCKGSLIANPDESQSWLNWEEKYIREFLDSTQIQDS